MKHKSGVLASSAARSTTNEECDKPNVRSSKRRGEVVELAFLYKAVSLGFGVAKPYGDSECYDFIVDWSGDSGAPNSRGDSHGLEPGGCLWRVQVKSTHRYRKGGLHCAGGCVVCHSCPGFRAAQVAVVLPAELGQQGTIRTFSHALHGRGPVKMGVSRARAPAPHSLFSGSAWPASII